MKRRDILTTSVGAIVAGAIGVSAFGLPSSAPPQSEDGAAARRYDRERRFAGTAFGRIAHIDRGKGLPQLTGIRRIDKAKLFFPEEYPDIIAAEARLLWDRAVRSS
jgi:hypothetical protein